MNIQQALSGLMVLAITLAVGSAAFAEDIYKWTDEDGNIHYEDRPSGARSEERLQISYNRTNSTDVQKRLQAAQTAATARRDARADADAERKTAAEAQAEAGEKDAKCQEYRGKLKTMLESRRLYRENAAGEREYLDDASRAEARTKAEELITEFCN